MKGLFTLSLSLSLDRDKTFVKALLVKAEALYNTCNFEHALVLFHRGQVRDATLFFQLDTSPPKKCLIISPDFGP